MKRSCFIVSSAIVMSFLIPMVSLSLAVTDDPISEPARKIHFSSIVLDTHIDVTPKLQTSWKFTDEHKEGTLICLE